MKRLRPVKQPTRAYKQLWRVVDGAVADCISKHPEYLSPKVNVSAVRGSITKRVTGSVLGYAVQTAKSRSSGSEAADKECSRSPRSILSTLLQSAGKRVEACLRIGPLYSIRPNSRGGAQ